MRKFFVIFFMFFTLNSLSHASYIWKPYVNPDLGIQMKYPAQWDSLEKWAGTIIAFVTPAEGPADPFQENVSLIVYTGNRNDDWLKAATGKDLQFTEIMGHPAKKIEYDLKLNGQDLKFLQVWMVKGDKTFLFTYSAEKSRFDKYLNEARGIIHSFNPAYSFTR